MLSETIELRGHIIDSLILPKVLDEIITHGGSFKMSELRIGERREDQSFARMEVSAPSAEEFDELMLRLRQHGAELVRKKNAETAFAPAEGVFPQQFYVTTNEQTFVRLGDQEIEVRPAIMDSAISVDRKAETATATKFYGVRKGDEIVVGHEGIRVAPVQRSGSPSDLFGFGKIAVNKPKSMVIQQMARELRRAHGAGEKILVVGGPAIVHTGAARYFEKLIQWGYVDLLVAGNSLAAHDIENALYGTSLGVYVDEPKIAEPGHENHLRAINAIRGVGGIRQAVQAGVLKSGIMCSCVKHKVDFVLAGSVRDEGPLPDVITDVLEAQQAIRAKIAGIGVALLMGSMQHSMAVRNMLPATVKTMCVDIDPQAVTKLTERGSFQTIGLVTAIEPFFRELAENISRQS